MFGLIGMQVHIWAYVYEVSVCVTRVTVVIVGEGHKIKCHVQISVHGHGRVGLPREQREPGERKNFQLINYSYGMVN